MERQTALVKSIAVVHRLQRRRLSPTPYVKVGKAIHISCSRIHRVDRCTPFDGVASYSSKHPQEKSPLLLAMRVPLYMRRYLELPRVIQEDETEHRG